MPIVTVKIAGPTLAPEQIARIQRRATELAAEILNTEGELTCVIVERIAAPRWLIGAATMHIAAHLDIKVAAGSKTAHAKARFVAEANALLKKILGGPLPAVSYVVIDEIAAESFGYDGLTRAVSMPPAAA